MYFLKLRAYDVESNTFLRWRAMIFLNLAFHRVEVVQVEQSAIPSQRNLNTIEQAKMRVGAIQNNFIDIVGVLEHGGWGEKVGESRIDECLTHPDDVRLAVFIESYDGCVSSFGYVHVGAGGCEAYGDISGLDVVAVGVRALAVECGAGVRDDGPVFCSRGWLWEKLDTFGVAALEDRACCAGDEFDGGRHCSRGYCSGCQHVRVCCGCAKHRCGDGNCKNARREGLSGHSFMGKVETVFANRELRRCRLGHALPDRVMCCDARRW